MFFDIHIVTSNFFFLKLICLINRKVFGLLLNDHSRIDYEFASRNET